MTGKLGPWCAVDPDLTPRALESGTGSDTTCPNRIPPAFPDEELRENAIHICGRRGYHGPFLNEAVYDWFGGIWAGSGDCYFCMNTKNVKAERIAQKGHV